MVQHAINTGTAKPIKLILRHILICAVAEVDRQLGGISKRGSSWCTRRISPYSLCRLYVLELYDDNGRTSLAKIYETLDTLS